ncbi:hypothetical protein GCM10011495_26100 [Hymenobacter frigidus]|uniref:PAS domain-containing protein n=2 Tax=Hymenobacter frigidus TaxID=1524095 RepID=A0ABQ2AAC5_9BACT|nr:hypothetical protein GCM10011495_26100 [Hymenobacter frigidus]
MAAPGSDAQVQALGRELQHTKHRLQTTIEEMESSLEELKSTNEELQSTNEEAMTNKEEMQSLNEELMTLNTQYLSKTEELRQAANDMKNLLDANQRVLAFSGAFAKFFGFDPARIKGSPLHELDGGAWQQPALAQRLEEALRHPDELFEDFQFTATFPSAGARSLLLYGRAITSHGTQTGWLLLGMQEIGQEQLTSAVG